MKDPITVHSLPPELLLETFQHLAELEPLGTVDYDEDEDLSDAESLGGSEASSTGTLSYDDEYSTDSESMTSSQRARSTYSHHPTFSLGWTRITHICSKWREIVISTPSLWTRIPLNLPSDWVYELLRRAKDAPLDIHIPETQIDSFATKFLCDINIQRIRSIICENPHIPVLELIAKNVSDDSPTVLEELDLAGVSSSAIALNSFKSLRRLDILLRSDDPTLDSLTGFISLPLLAELTFAMHYNPIGIFELEEPMPDVPISGNWSTLLGNLTVLELIPVPFIFDIADEIVLPRLRELTLEEDLDSCGTFFQHVQVPFLKRYDVQYNQPRCPETVDLDMVKAMGFSRVLDHADASIPALYTLAISHAYSYYSHTIAVYAWRFPQPYEEKIEFPFDDTQMKPTNTHISHCFDLTPAGDSEVIQLSNFTQVFLSHPALSTLRMLSLDLHPRLGAGDAAVWYDLFRPMRQLRHLRITSPRSESGVPMGILNALKTHSIHQTLATPFLERLTLVDWDPDMSTTEDQRNPPAGMVLRDVIRERQTLAARMAVHIVCWRRCHEAAWRLYLAGADVEVVYERLFLSLGHLHTTDRESTVARSESDQSEVSSPTRRLAFAYPEELAP